MNKAKIFNTKLFTILMIFFMILSTLLINNVVAYTTEMKSESDYPEIGHNVGDTAQTSYEDLIKYYSVLCCEHGRELADGSKTILTVSYGGNTYTYDAGNVTANDLGMVLFKHKVYRMTSDFSQSKYKSYTWGRYEVVSNEIATPKEAYILAEMSEEVSAGATLHYKFLINDEGERERYYGGVFESESFYLSSTETIYYVNHKYVLETEEGNYYVSLGHDSEGNPYYVFDTYSDGSLREYGGKLSYGNNKNGAEVEFEGVEVDNVYYEFNGTISAPGTSVPGSGTLYLLSYDTVVSIEGTLYECELEGKYSYIQIAWWSTEAGSRYNSIPVTPNTLAMEAEAFEAYILTITGKTSVSELEMIQTEQKYVLHDEDGNEIDTGYITAPKIEYQPEWNEDANQNGELDIADEVTIAFDVEANQYKVGPFSINYVKDGAEVESREPVDFSCITGVKLITNLGELELGKDWNFEWQYGERTPEDKSEYPNPNEVFYITINYIEGLTKIENFHFDFKFMNAGGLYSDLQGFYHLCTWGVHLGEAVYKPWDLDGDGIIEEGEEKFSYRYTWVSLDGMEERREQELAHAIIGVRWYDYRELEFSKDIPEDEEQENKGYIKVEKNVIDAEGQLVDVNDTFVFNVYVDKKDGKGLRFFETLSFEVVNGHGEDTSSEIKWLGEEDATYYVIEVEYNEEKYESKGPWSGTLANGETASVVNIQAVNVIDNESGRIRIEKQILDDSLENNSFMFNVRVTGNFKYQGYTHTSNVPLIIPVTISKANNWSWESADFTWVDDNAPSYVVTEIIPEDANYFLVGNIINGKGTLIADETVVAIAQNDTEDEEEEDVHGRLQIEKKLYDENGNEIIGREFIFDVTIGDQTFPVTIKSGEVWRSDLYTWKENEPAPKYNVVERDGAKYNVKYENQSGTLTSEGTAIVTVKVENTLEIHKGNLKISKELILNDKIKEQDVTASFDFTVTLKGTFKYNGKDYIDATKRFDVTLSNDLGWSWTSDDIYWYDEAPSYAIEETNIPSNWMLVEMSENASGKLQEDTTIEITCINEYTYDTVILLTMELGGKVWDDTAKDDKHQLPNGIIEENEPGIENVLVSVYRVVVDQNGKVLARLGNALVYDDNDKVTLLENSSTYTDSTGNWSLGTVSVPAYLSDEEKAQIKATYGESSTVSYDIEFTYDGQTYEPTKFLALDEGGETTRSCSASEFRGASTSERDKWLKSSTVIDAAGERNSFNLSFETITGRDPMDANGNTTGLAIGNGTSKELHYTSVNQASTTNSDITRKVSTLETTDENNYIYDEMKLNSRTSTGGLTYPFDNRMHLINWDKETTDVFKVTKVYSATYNYMLSINLGLNERETTDVALEKDLNTAMVVVNGKALKYKYNRAIDLETEQYDDLLYKQLEVEKQSIDYELGLYSSDYYYRANIYDGSTTGSELDGYYTNRLNLPLDSTEMDVYLTYLISIHNESATYDLQVNSVSDYYDSNLEVITNNSPYDVTHKYVQEINGTEVNAVTQVAEGSKAIFYTADNQEIKTVNINWTDNVETMLGSDGVEYTRMTTGSLINDRIAHGGRVDLYVTFRVEKDSINEAGIYDAIKLGKKYNISEIDSFTSYYTDASNNSSLWAVPGNITGRIDGDSAPNNINITSLNEKAFYEDDTDSAPSIKLVLNDFDRNVEGIAFEDAQTQEIEYKQYIGDGIYNPDSGDKTIKDVKTEIVEIVKIPQNNGTYKEYEFEWPTDKKFVELGNKSIYELTGFDQEVVTNGNGEYRFNSIPAGNYVVRFVYGDNDQELKTGNTDNQVVYNGQDYKSTAYQVGFESITDTNSNGYVDNEWHDLTNSDLSNVRVSDVRDNEARRLYITSKSQTLIYENASVLDTADSLTADHTELFGDFDSAEVSATGPIYGNGYYMYADTAKLNLSVENLYEIAEGAPNNSLTTINVGGLEVSMIEGNATVNGVGVGTTNFVYTVKNLDCGIEERSKSAIVLDKQIKEIVLRTSDGNVILDAIYDINYEVVDNKVIANVKLNTDVSVGYDKIAGLNRSGSSQGFRYIMAEGQILQGTSLEIKYQLTAFNISETDRCSAILRPLWESVNTATTEQAQKDIVNNAVAKLATTTYSNNQKVHNGQPVEYGMYFGSIYYQGKDGNTTDDIVETKVRQIIDYVDNDAVFADTLNVAKDNAWSNTTIEYLLENGLIDPSVVQIIDGSGNITGDTRADREKTSGERYAILDEEYQEYITDIRNNLVLNNDSAENEDGANPGLIKYLEPYAKTNSIAESSATATLYVSRYFASEADANNIDNLAEIIKTENTVGRRDVKSVAGNVNPFALSETGEPIGEYAVALTEPDSSATELITLSPPTGMDSTENRTTQLLVVILVAVVIVAVGIFVIKKKVLDKK